MANKQARTRGNAKEVLIEQPELRKHAHPAKGRPINKQKRMDTLKECLLTNKKPENMHNQLRDGQYRENVEKC